MPNMKIYVDDRRISDWQPALVQALGPIRASLMRQLGVTQAACHLVILPAIGLPDQPAVSVEVQILPHPDRTRPVIIALGHEVQAHLAAATGARVAFRCMQHDPPSYVVVI